MTNVKQADVIESLAATAQAATEALEVFSPAAWMPEDTRRGESAPWGDRLRAAEGALEALQAAATAELFPDRVVPVGSDLWADFDAYTKAARHDGDRLVRLHGAALEGHPDLAIVFRTAHVLSMVERAAHQATLVTGVAEQLAERGECLPASRILATDLAELQRRISTAIARCEAEAAARSRAELAAWFREHLASPDRPAQIGHEMLAGPDIAARIDAGDDELTDLARHYWLHHPAGGGRSSGGRAIFA